MSAYAWTAHSRAVHSRSASRYAARSPVQEKQARRSRARCTTCSVAWASSGQARRGMAVAVAMNNAKHRSTVDLAAQRTKGGLRLPQMMWRQFFRLRRHGVIDHGLEADTAHLEISRTCLNQFETAAGRIANAAPIETHLGVVLLHDHGAAGRWRE